MLLSQRKEDLQQRHKRARLRQANFIKNNIGGKDDEKSI